MLLALVGLLSVAHAATVAVLPLDGYGVSWDDTETVTQGLRDAFLGESGLNPLTGSDINDGLSGPFSGELALARERASSARRAYQARDAEAALALVDEGIDLHYQALSDVARRAELADAWYLKALCLFALERDDEARDAFLETSFLYPKYLANRASSLPSAAIGIAAEGQAMIETGRKRVRTTDSVGEIGGALGVEFVVTGWVTGEGEIVARIYENGTYVAEERARLSELPALPVDDAYGTLASALARDVRGTPAPVKSGSSRYTTVEDDAAEREAAARAARDREEREDEERAAREREEREDEERAAQEREEREREEREREEREDEQRAAREREEREDEERAAREREEEEAARAREEREEREREEREARAADREDARAERAQEREENPGACAADDAPITCKWWFWAATAGGAGGVSALLGYAAYEPPPIEKSGPPTWSVEIAD